MIIYEAITDKAHIIIENPEPNWFHVIATPRNNSGIDGDYVCETLEEAFEQAEYSFGVHKDEFKPNTN